MASHSATFNQMVTATGRLSSSGQICGIPCARSKIRALFLPDLTMILLLAPSQIELRILAHLSEDPALMKAFADGDIHRFTAAEVLGKKPEDVTSTERSHAKAATASVLFTASVISVCLAIWALPRRNTLNFISTRYQVKEYGYGGHGSRNGSVRTLFGRVRALRTLTAVDALLCGTYGNRYIIQSRSRYHPSWP